MYYIYMPPISLSEANEEYITNHAEVMQGQCGKE